ncbi:MAG: mandelate racemase/muconate lactonizing enzyme family protein [Candidatus Latescibacterota bacterium]
MRITGLRTYKFSVPTRQEVRDPHTGQLLCSTAKPWLFLKVETDAGICGWGEGTGEWLVPSVEATLREWSGLLVGQDPLRPQALTDDIADRLPWKGGPVFGTALAAVNAALYDLTGRAWGVPVHAILGGRRRDRVRAYAGADLFVSPETAAQEVRRVMALGYAGAKGVPLETRTWPMDREAVEHSLRCLAAARQAAGPHFDLLLDAHGSPAPELSLELARAAAPLSPLFLEEPAKVGSLEALLAVSRQSPVPVATGEKLFTVREFKPLVDCRACAFLQPDLTHAFGIGGMVDIARLAATAQMLLAPHNAGGPLCLAATLQVDAAVPNFLIQEMSPEWFARFREYVEHDWRVEAGYVNVPEAPGLGVEVKEADIAQLPYEPLPYRQYRHADGSWKGW